MIRTKKICLLALKVSLSLSMKNDWKMVTKERELNHWSRGGTHKVGLSRNGEVSRMDTLQGHMTKYEL